MGVNIRTKGQQGEREFAKLLNDIVDQERKRLGMTTLEDRDKYFQRNQNQSAVGGDDLTNPMLLCIEVKRQEALSINTWWKQCKESAARTDGGIAILAFRQSRKKWRIMVEGSIPLAANVSFGPVRLEMTIDDFLSWFRHYSNRWLQANA